MTTYSVLETEEALLPSPVGRRRRGFWDYVPFAVAALVAVQVVVVLCHVFVPAGEYLLSSTIPLASAPGIHGEGTALLRQTNAR